MGYRSEVVIVVRSDLADQIPDTKRAGSYPTFIEFAKRKDVHDWTMYRWSSIKWYDDTYESVKAVMAWLRTLPNEAYSYFRLGEDSGDFEHFGEACNQLGCPFDIWVKQELVDNYGDEE